MIQPDQGRQVNYVWHWRCGMGDDDGFPARHFPPLTRRRIRWMGGLQSNRDRHSFVIRVTSPHLRHHHCRCFARPKPHRRYQFHALAYEIQRLVRFHSPVLTNWTMSAVVLMDFHPASSPASR